MAKRNLYAINAGIVKKGGASQDGHYRSLDKIIWDILKCCGIDCCNEGGDNNTPSVTSIVETNENVLEITYSNGTIHGITLIPTLTFANSALSVSGGTPLDLGVSNIDATAGTKEYYFISPYQLSLYLQTNYKKYTETSSVTESNHAIALTPAYRTGFQNWFQVSKNGILLHEGTGANTYTIVNSTQITIDSVTTGDFIEVKYMA
jgi:hypothetical protein